MATYVKGLNDQKASTQQYFVIFALFIVAAAYLRDFRGLGVPPLLFVFFCGLAFLYLNYGDTVAFIAFLVPLANGLPFNYIISIAFLIIIVRRFNKTRLDAGMVWVILLVVYESLHLFIDPASIKDFISFGAAIILLGFLLLDKHAEYVSEKVVLSFSLGLLVALFDIVVHTLQSFSYSITTLLQSGVRLGNVRKVTDSYDVMMITQDQNALGFYCIVAIALLLVASSRNSKVNMYAIPLIGVFTFFGLMTMSKGFIISLTAVAFIFTGYLLLSRSTNAIKGIVLLVIAIGVVSLVVNMFFPILISLIVDRFMVDDISSGRISIFGYFLDFQMSNLATLLFGVGIQSINIKGGVAYFPHSSIQEVLVAWGFIGLVMSALFINAFIVNSKALDVERTNFLSYFPLLIYLFYSFGHHLFTEIDLTLMFLPVFCSWANLKNMTNSDGGIMTETSHKGRKLYG